MLRTDESLEDDVI